MQNMFKKSLSSRVLMMHYFWTQNGSFTLLRKAVNTVFLYFLVPFIEKKKKKSDLWSRLQKKTYNYDVPLDPLSLYENFLKSSQCGFRVMTMHHFTQNGSFISNKIFFLEKPWIFNFLVKLYFERFKQIL